MTRFLPVFFVLLLTAELLFSQKLALKDSLQFKIAPSLRIPNSVTSLRVQVSDSTEFINWVSNNLPDAKIIKQLPFVYQVKGISKASIDVLLTSPWITFIDRGNRVAREEETLPGFDFTLNRIPALHAKYPSLLGENLVLSVKEKPFDIENIDFKGRVVLNDQFDEDPTQHATAMATIMAGAGNSNVDSRGLAPSASITTSDFSQLLPDNGSTLTALNVSVQNHSYGVGVENYYGIESFEYDKQCRDIQSMVHVFSSGNDGDKADITGAYAGLTGFANLTGQFKTSKNTISVGSTDKYGNITIRSSRGPAHDGRVKPELAAFGDGGSSESAGLVTGVVTLIQEAYKKKYGNLPPSALVKAILINSAQDAGRPEVDHEYGFGNLNGLSAIRTIENGLVYNGSCIQNQVVPFLFSLPQNVKNLKVTLVWNDPPGTVNGSKALVNDLDLELKEVSTSGTWKPWVLSSYPHPDSLRKPAERKQDHLNNVEQVTLASAAAGNYEIQIHGFNINSTQDFSVVYQWDSSFEWTYPVKNYEIDGSENSILRWQGQTTTSVGSLYLKYTGSTDWKLIANDLILANQFYEWQPPDTIALAQLRMVSGATEFLSDTFAISKPIAIRVGFNCDDQVMISWESTEDNPFFVVSKLGQKFMEPFAEVMDTLAVITKSVFGSEYVRVTSKLDNQVLRRSVTVNYENQGVGCYVRSFLPREVLTSKAVFDFSIGTNFQIQSIEFQKKFNGEFTTLEAKSPVQKLAYIFEDNQMSNGSNIYRVKINATDRTAYSQEEIVFKPGNDVFVFPNPVDSGNEISVVGASELPLQMNVYNSTGSKIFETVLTGTIKTFQTSQLQTGIYFLQFTSSDGSRYTSRILIQ